MRRIDYGRVASIVARYFCSCKRVSETSFIAALKDVVYRSEAIRLMRYFISKGILVPQTKKTYFMWGKNVTLHHFRDDFGPKVDYFKRVFEDNQIQTDFTPNKYKSVRSEVIGSFESINMSDLTAFDDESLERMRQCITNEQQRREAEIKKQHKIEEILSVLEMSREDLLNLLA